MLIRSDPDKPREWPKISSNSEKTRYDNVKPLCTALEKKGTLSARETQHKAAFQDSVAKIAGVLASAIEKVASVDQKTNEVITEVVDLAGRTWLECSSQPYRVMVVLPEGNGDILTADSSGGRPKLSLILRPSLKRWGNGQGQDLTNEQMISGWKASEVVYEVQ